MLDDANSMARGGDLWPHAETALALLAERAEIPIEELRALLRGGGSPRRRALAIREGADLLFDVALQLIKEAEKLEIANG